jgi:hypothetical protein
MARSRFEPLPDLPDLLQAFRDEWGDGIDPSSLNHHPSHWEQLSVATNCLPTAESFARPPKDAGGATPDASAITANQIAL